MNAKSHALKEKTDKHYSNANQRKMHYASIKGVVKQGHRAGKYKSVNQTFPV